MPGSIQVTDATNVTITRNNVSNIFLLNTSNLLLIENVIINAIQVLGSNKIVPNMTVQRNIVCGSLLDINGGATFSNNIFTRQNLYQYNGNYFFLLSNNELFQNNIFLAATNYFGTGANTATSNNIFNNNLFVADSTALIKQSGLGNIFNQNASNIFINYPLNSQWTSKQNFHLKVGSAGIGKGTDGKDVGIFGSSSPFKEGGIPFNPHFQSINIANTTDTNGNLSISIIVKAQNN